MVNKAKYTILDTAMGLKVVILPSTDMSHVNIEFSSHFCRFGRGLLESPRPHLLQTSFEALSDVLAFNP